MARARRLTLPILAASALGTFPACSSSSSTSDSGGSSTPAITSSATCPTPEAGSGTPVGATLQGGYEGGFSIELDTNSVKAGSTTFSVDNTGPATHEFVVLATDLAPNALPVSEDFGTPVDEKGKGVTRIDKTENISVGCSASLTLDLDPGNYVVICNLSAHYVEGMYAPLKVK